MHIRLGKQALFAHSQSETRKFGMLSLYSPHLLFHQHHLDQDTMTPLGGTIKVCTGLPNPCASVTAASRIIRVVSMLVWPICNAAVYRQADICHCAELPLLRDSTQGPYNAPEAEPRR